MEEWWSCPRRVVIDNAAVRATPLTAGFSEATTLARINGRRTNCHVYLRTPAGDWDGFKVELVAENQGIESVLASFIIGAAGMETLPFDASRVELRQGLILFAMDVPCDAFIVRARTNGAVTSGINGRLVVEAWGPER